MAQMEDKEPSVSREHVLELLQTAAVLGVDGDVLTSLARNVRLHERRIPVRHGPRFWTELAAHVPAVLAGPRFAAASTRTFARSALPSRGAKTNREALIRLTTMGTCGDAQLHTEAGQTGTAAHVSMSSANERAGHAVEYALFSLLRTLSESGAGAAALVREVHFRHEPLGPRRMYEAYFGRTPRFGSTSNRLVLDEAMLDRAYRLSPLVTLHLSVTHRAGAPRPSPSAHLRRSVDAAVAAGDYTVDAVAAHAGVGVRALQRRAKDAGVSLRELIRAARERRAKQALADPGAALVEIAEDLDYSDERAFSRAFQRWTGVTPARWRRRHRPAGND